MLTIAAAILPNFALIVLGWAMRARRWLEPAFWTCLLYTSRRG